MLKRFCIALAFVAAGGIIAARADSTTAAGQSQKAPQAVPCPPPIVHRKPTAASRKRAALSLVPAP